MSIKLILSDEQATHLRNIIANILDNKDDVFYYSNEEYLKPIKERIDKQLYGD